MKFNLIITVIGFLIALTVGSPIAAKDVMAASDSLDQRQDACSQCFLDYLTCLEPCPDNSFCVQLCQYFQCINGGPKCQACGFTNCSNP
ncbi:hypothetical protein K432DRAFT_408079 [Lepidopterella palustris CBS 459.81]|uniref:Uncharacterized protein n=1 Tax=Lepidopterella palustris CBS 459.81 TaxID=1314670 RepID=A0A8E2E3C7_9PEZI|nr:hypothetical protein K432DRAFT_408079 [Lepidopterella palustris CBS 459.81]